MTKLSAPKKLKTLLMRALRIEDAIGREQRKRWPDGLRLLHLKKLRLAIKDRLYRLTRRNDNKLSV
jgi:hypothetical protein